MEKMVKIFLNKKILIGLSFVVDSVLKMLQDFENS